MELRVNLLFNFHNFTPLIMKEKENIENKKKKKKKKKEFRDENKK